ncbi:M15 family metallopeptidase [Halalkalibacter kiskunsagensis]|uniref:M15 family metallopeptidase n=1 Tax=Halalkalibacter kiskunsagensis TaxID=1548599 RepID=A0ABV6KBJ0_9BACI
MKPSIISVILLGLTILFFTGCSTEEHSLQQDPPLISSSQISDNDSNSEDESKEDETSKDDRSEMNSEDQIVEEHEVEVETNPESTAVLVNKEYSLPEGHKPEDLVYPNIPFTFEEKIEKRQMREEAAMAIEELFSAAEMDGLSLLGVSAYRSYDTQKALFNYYVERDGEEKARTYSAVPGSSEHQTGLAIDVTASYDTCVVEVCFAETEEAKWLEENAADYGFIIRYLEGKESITGYQYEPWHLRYVGKEIAKEIVSLGVTLEEYMNAVPVSN